MAQTSEQRHAYLREYYAQNRERLLEKNKAWRAKNPERQRAYGAAYYAENRENLLAQQSAARQGDGRDRRRAYNREYYQRTRTAQLARARERYQSRAGREYIRAYRVRTKHGMQPEDWAALWEAQDGRCYLCGCELTADKAVIDHNHSCCPAESSCRTCRRGLACSNCNVAVGMATDDPARLRQMADALEAAQRAVEHRKADAYEQIPLFETDEREMNGSR